MDGKNNGIWYKFQGDYYIPCLAVLAEEGRPSLSIVDLVRKKAIIHLEQRYQNFLDEMGSEKQWRQ